MYLASLITAVQVTFLTAGHTDDFLVVLEVATIEDFLDLFDSLREETTFSSVLSAAALAVLSLGFAALTDDVAKLEASEANHLLWTLIEWMS